MIRRTRWFSLVSPKSSLFAVSEFVDVFSLVDLITFYIKLPSTEMNEILDKISLIFEHARKKVDRTLTRDRRVRCLNLIDWVRKRRKMLCLLVNEKWDRDVDFSDVDRRLSDYLLIVKLILDWWHYKVILTSLTKTERVEWVKSRAWTHRVHYREVDECHWWRWR
jgi:hypothetical protein